MLSFVGRGDSVALPFNPLPFAVSAKSKAGFLSAFPLSLSPSLIQLDGPTEPEGYDRRRRRRRRDRPCEHCTQSHSGWPRSGNGGMRFTIAGWRILFPLLLRFNGEIAMRTRIIAYVALFQELVGKITSLTSSRSY